MDVLQAARQLARDIVYGCGDGENYVQLLENLRGATTRNAFMEAVDALLVYRGKLQKIEMDKDAYQNLFSFLQTGDRQQISSFRSALITQIANVEVEKIRQHERRLLRLLEKE